jgi:hypothetical protein
MTYLKNPIRKKFWFLFEILLWFKNAKCAGESLKFRDLSSLAIISFEPVHF